MQDRVNERRELRLFFTRMGLFAAPIFLFFLFTLFLFVVSGEVVSLRHVIHEQAQSARQVLFGPAYSNSVFYYKLQSVIDRKPEILALGTSRIMQMRSEFFTHPNVFFNAGGVVDRVHHMHVFLDHIQPGQEPAVIILALDQNFFSAAWDAANPVQDIEQKYAKPESVLHILITQWSTLYDDMIHHKFSLSDVLSPSWKFKAVGLNARVRANGFRNDGSRREETIMGEDPFKHLQSLYEATTEFALGSADSATISELSGFLAEAKKRGIYVIGMIPPYSPNLYAAMIRASADEKKQIAYVLELEPALRPVFRMYDFPLYDFIDARSYGSSDSEMLDNQHGSEKTYLRLFIQMAQTDMRLGQYADIDSLREKLYNSSNYFTVFGEK